MSDERILFYYDCPLFDNKLDHIFKMYKTVVRNDNLITTHLCVFQNVNKEIKML